MVGNWLWVDVLNRTLKHLCLSPVLCLAKSESCPVSPRNRMFSPLFTYDSIRDDYFCPMLSHVFLWGGSIVMYHRRKSSPFQRWCCFQGQAVHGIPTGGCTLDPLTVRLFLREKKIRFPQDGAATCMVLVRTSDIYRNAKGTVDYIYVIYIYDVFIDICMTPWHILFSRQFFLQFLRSCDFGMSLPAETGLALCEPLWAINQAPPRHFFIAQRWNR